MHFHRFNLMLRPDLDTVKRTLSILFREGDTVELRCIANGQVVNGYYRDLTKLAEDACRLNFDFSPFFNAFVCLSPVDPQLFARRANEFGRCGKNEASKDQDVQIRRWLLLDIDAGQPTGVMASASQKQQAFQLAGKVNGWLCEHLGPNSFIGGDSGNGGHMLLCLPDVPANAESRWVCERFLAVLNERFQDHLPAHIDTGMFNAARISALFGTIKRKGSDLPEQPHRLTSLLYVPEEVAPVDWQRLASFVDTCPTAQQGASAATNGRLDIDQVLQQRGVEAASRDDRYVTQSGERAVRWELEQLKWTPKTGPCNKV